MRGMKQAMMSAYSAKRLRENEGKEGREEKQREYMEIEEDKKDAKILTERMMQDIRNKVDDAGVLMRKIYRIRENEIPQLTKLETKDDLDKEDEGRITVNISYQVEFLNKSSTDKWNEIRGEMARRVRKEIAGRIKAIKIAELEQLIKEEEQEERKIIESNVKVGVIARATNGIADENLKVKIRAAVEREVHDRKLEKYEAYVDYHVKSKESKEKKESEKAKKKQEEEKNHQPVDERVRVLEERIEKLLKEKEKGEGKGEKRGRSREGYHRNRLMGNERVRSKSASGRREEPRNWEMGRGGGGRGGRGGRGGFDRRESRGWEVARGRGRGRGG